MEKVITFANKNNKKLVGILSSSSENIDLVVILCHGFTTNKSSFTNTTLTKILNEQDTATFRFDFFGHGESEGDFADITISEGVDDILRAIKLLKEMGYSKIGLVGSSFGGQTSLIAASKSDDLDFVVAKSPACDYMEIERGRKTKEELDNWESKGYVIHQNGQGKELKLNYSFWQDAQNNVAYDFAKDIKIPTFIVHGDSDNTVPVDQSRKIAKLIPNCKLVEVKGADHRYSDPVLFDQMIGLIVDYILSIK